MSMLGTTLVTVLLYSVVSSVQLQKVKDDMYQIQGVYINDDVAFESDYSKHGAHARINISATDTRSKRQVVPAFAPQQQVFGRQRAPLQLQQRLPQSRLPIPRRGPVGILSARAQPGSSGWTGSYYYPERRPLPLPKCFHNPTGYVCCNEKLNDLMVDTYVALETRPKFHDCNLQIMAVHLQRNAERVFNTSFETIVGYDDFAQKVRFRGDMVCKIELGSRFMLAYATASDQYNSRLPHNQPGGEIGFELTGVNQRGKREVTTSDDTWTSVNEVFV